MTRTFETLKPDQTNRPLQKQMAECLLSASVDEAIEFAVLNGWQGVLRELYGIIAARRGGGPHRPLGGAGSQPGDKHHDTARAHPHASPGNARPRSRRGRKRDFVIRP